MFSADEPAVGVELMLLSSPGAYVADLGLSGNGSKLTSSFPVLGASLTADVKDAPAGAISVLLMSAPNGGPTSFLTDPFSVSWIDPGSYSILGAYSVEDYSYSQAIPALPALAGVQLHMQAWALPGGAFPASTSNGLQLVLGN